MLLKKPSKHDALRVLIKDRPLRPDFVRYAMDPINLVKTKIVDKQGGILLSSIVFSKIFFESVLVLQPFSVFLFLVDVPWVLVVSLADRFSDEANFGKVSRPRNEPKRTVQVQATANIAYLTRLLKPPI